MNRLKNGIILTILISFLILVAIMPVNCIFKTVTGISCPACGMTRSFLCILQLNFIAAIYYNLFSIPLFLFLIVSSMILLKEFIQNQFNYILKVLKFFEKHYIMILILLVISFLFNNIKWHI